MPRHEIRQHDKRPDAAVILRDGQKQATVHKKVGDTITNQASDMSDDQATAAICMLLAMLSGAGGDPDVNGTGLDGDGDPTFGFGENDEDFDV